MSSSDSSSSSSNLRSLVYDYFITAMTTRWYRAFLCRLPPGSSVLDVGIGTATSLIANKDVILNRGLQIMGVDYDKNYVDAARESIRVAGLSKHIDVVCASIHDYCPPSGAKKSGGVDAQQEDVKYDAIYFSGSFMIIPDKVKALERCKKMLVPNTGKFYFTQSFQHRGWMGNLVSSVVKPMLKFVLTIDFGDVTYRDEFEQTMKDAGLKIELYEIIFKASMRDEVLVIAA